MNNNIENRVDILMGFTLHGKRTRDMADSYRRNVPLQIDMT